MDVLKKSPKLNMADLESPDTIGALHTLYSMTLTPIGQLQTKNTYRTSLHNDFAATKSKHAHTYYSAFCKQLLNS